MSRHATIVVTYFPNPDAIKNLNRLSDLGDVLIVIDNTPLQRKKEFPARSNVVVWNSSENIGLAAGLNMGMELAGEQGIADVFLLDQDSRPPDHYFQQMLTFKSRLIGAHRNFAFYVPNFYDRNSKTFAAFPLLDRFSLRHITCRGMPSLVDNSALIAITSGMLIPIETYHKIGPFREDYFIDFIDNEYCLRANMLGYSVAVNCDLILDHAVGHRSVRTLFGLTIKPNHHDPIRRYYIFRNGIRTTIDYFRWRPSYALLMTARLVHEILSVMLYEGNKQRKIRKMVHGAYHGFTGRMGKLQATERVHPPSRKETVGLLL